MSTLVSARAPSGESAGIRAADILLVPWMVAGVQTQFEQMRATRVLKDARVVEINPFREGALIERLPLRGTLRSTLAAARTLPVRGIRAVWTQVALPMLPFVLSRSRRRAAVFYAIDCTPILLHRLGGLYPGVDDPATAQGFLTGACLRLFLRRCAGVLPWSEWAARSMIQDYGVPPEKVRVVAPGIDVERWKPLATPERSRPRILFVGADFERKGGPLLLDVFRRHLRGQFELRIISRSEMRPDPGVEVFTGLNVGDARIRELYQTSDVVVIPTLADCYSMAALEAMACGLPVIVSAVGAIPEIVVHGQTGMLIRPGSGEALLAAIRTLFSSSGGARRMGLAGRARVEQRFDASKQAAATVDFMATAAAAS